MNERIGSIIERPLKGGGFSYQAIVKIPGAKAAVKTCKDREGAEEFLRAIRMERDKTAVVRKQFKERWIAPASEAERSVLNQELWANEWLKETLKHYYESDRVKDKSKRTMLNVIKFGGDVRLGELDKKWVRDYIAFARKQKTRTKAPYKWATIADHLKNVSAAMSWRAEELEAKGARLPFSMNMFPKDWDVKRKRRLSPDEERMFIARLRGIKMRSSPHWVRLFRLALNTAARLQELVLAEWSEFDIARRCWTIPANHTKCNKERVVPLNKAALRALRVMKLIEIKSSPRVFHEITSAKSVSNCFYKMKDSMGIRDFRFHDLRHEAISRMVLKQRHLSVFEIMDIVGHSDIQMLKRYANLRGEELAAKLID